MLVCPYCGARVSHQGRDNWFECPSCRQWICLRVGQNGSTWFDTGVLANGMIHSVQIVRERGQPVRTPMREQPETPPSALPNIGNMDLPAVRTQRQRITTRLRQLEADIQRVINLRTQNLQNDQLTRQYNTELSQFTQEQNELHQFQQRLTERENSLQPVTTPATGPGSSSPSGLIFGCGTVLGFAGIMVFTRMINLHLDSRAFMWVILIAVGAGFCTWLIAQFNR